MKFSESFQIWLAGLITGICMMGIVGLVFWPTPKPVIQVVSPPKPVSYENNSINAVFVRGDRWNILVGTKDDVLQVESAYGYTDCSQQNIYIASSLTYGNQRDTILHELLHAGTCDTDGNLRNTYYNSDDGHGSIFKIANYISTLLHDNPELARYLAGQ